MWMIRRLGLVVGERSWGREQGRVLLEPAFTNSQLSSVCSQRLAVYTVPSTEDRVMTLTMRSALTEPRLSSYELHVPFERHDGNLSSHQNRACPGSMLRSKLRSPHLCLTTEERRCRAHRHSGRLTRHRPRLDPRIGRPRNLSLPSFTKTTLPSQEGRRRSSIGLCHAPALYGSRNDISRGRAALCLQKRKA